MIAILGGGVAGAALAWALGEAGCGDVTVFDPRPPGEGSSGRALGGFRTQQGSRLNTELCLASREFFVQLGDRIGFRPCGYLYLAETDEAAAELGRRSELQRGWGVPVEHPDPRTICPFLQTDDLRLANFCRLDGVYSPRLVLEAYLEKAREAGVTFRYSESAPAGELEGADAVVIAAGAWSRSVGESAGIVLDVTPLERGIYQVGPLGWLTGSEPMVLEVGSGYHFREQGGFLLVMFPGDQNRWQPVGDWLGRRVPGAARMEPAGHWTGFYEMTKDGHPLVGETERTGIWACCGFGGHGIMQSPAIARSLAAMILGQTPPIDLGSLAPTRDHQLVDGTQM